MLQLVSRYSVSEIFVFVILLALATKSIVEFFNWAQEKICKIFRLKHNKLTEKEKIHQQLTQQATSIEVLKEQQKVTDEHLRDVSEKIDLLIDSDKDAIKSYITKQHHHFCYEIKEIDDFSLDCLEKRYKHYSDEGGNSFIAGFMEDLRKLPKHHH